MPSSAVFTQSVTTSYVALAAHRGENVSILNNTGDVINVRYASVTTEGSELTLEIGQSVGLGICASSREIEIKAGAGTDGVMIVVH